MRVQAAAKTGLGFRVWGLGFRVKIACVLRLLQRKGGDPGP